MAPVDDESKWATPGRIAAGLVPMVLWGTACVPDAPPDRSIAYEEFCLEGEFDLGARLQGLRPAPGEFHATRWCVVSSEEEGAVLFSATGPSNPDVTGSFTVAYPAADRVRLVNAEAPPDVEFRGALAGDEAPSVRRLDPARLVTELARHPEWVVGEAEDGSRAVRWPGAAFLSSVLIRQGHLEELRTSVELPLRGLVPVVWRWRRDAGIDDVGVDLSVDGHTVFRGVGRRRALDAAESEALWRPSGGVPPREVPGAAWPATIRMRVETLSPGVHLVRGVRTGFHHLVVETAAGLVVADAPAGWVELTRVPPADLVPGLGVSGLSEEFVDFLQGHWPGMPLRAVVLTHAHDDHAGGARAFAAAGARVYAPAPVTPFLETALNRESMPQDRLAAAGDGVRLTGVDSTFVLDDPGRPVRLISLGESPHVAASLGVHVPSAGVFFQSDLHVPAGEGPAPRPDRLESECWFARWAVAHLPPGTVVHNSHGTTALPVRHLAGYLEEGCGP